MALVGRLAVVSDDWKDRVAALHELTALPQAELVSQLQLSPAQLLVHQNAHANNHHIHSSSSSSSKATNLAACLVVQMGDRRSMVIKEVCAAVASLAQSMGSDDFALLGAFLLPKLLQLLRVTIEAISDAAATCIDRLVPHATGKAAATDGGSSDDDNCPMVGAFVEGTKHSHAKVRAACFRALSGIMAAKPTALPAAQQAVTTAAVVGGARDPTGEVRSLVKKCYAQCRKNWPGVAAKALESADVSTRKILGAKSAVASKVDSRHAPGSSAGFRAMMEQKREQQRLARAQAASKAAAGTTVAGGPERFKPSYEKPWLAKSKGSTDSNSRKSGNAGNPPAAAAPTAAATANSTPADDVVVMVVAAKSTETATLAEPATPPSEDASAKAAKMVGGESAEEASTETEGEEPKEECDAEVTPQKEGEEAAEEEEGKDAAPQPSSPKAPRRALAPKSDEVGPAPAANDLVADQENSVANVSAPDLAVQKAPVSVDRKALEKMTLAQLRNQATEIGVGTPQAGNKRHKKTWIEHIMAQP